MSQTRQLAAIMFTDIVSLVYFSLITLPGDYADRPALKKAFDKPELKKLFELRRKNLKSQ